MLVLTRKIGEKIAIGNGLIVSVLDVGSGRVRLGIDAPADVIMRRTELDCRPPEDSVLPRRAR